MWCNSRPQEESYPVALQYSDTSGRVKALPSPAALLQAAEQQLLGGRTLLWLPPARDAALQEAARLLGAANSDVAAAGRAPAAAKATGAVLVRGSDADAVPATYRRLPWTTPALLLVSARAGARLLQTWLAMLHRPLACHLLSTCCRACLPCVQVGMLEGSLDSAVHLPEEEPDTTPSAAKKGGKGRGGSGSKAAPGRRSTAAGGKSKGRAGARGGKGGDSQQQDSGSETDVSEDLSHLRGTQRVLAAEVSKPSPPSAAEAAAARHDQQDQQDQQHGEEAPVVSGAAAAGQAASPRRHGRKIAVGAAVAIATAASPGEAGASQGAAAGGRKRRQPEHQEQQEEEEEMLPTASKKQRQGAPTAAAAATAQQQQQLVEMPAAEGWHTKQHGHTDEPEAAVGSRDTSPAGRQPVRPSAAAAAASAAKPAPAGAGGGGGRRGARAASAAAAAAAEADREMAGGEEEQVEDPEAGEEGGGAAVVAYLPLVVPRLPPSASAAASGGARGRGRGSSNAAAATGGLPNYKAFRKGGDGGVAAAVGRRVVGYDAEPYVADGPADADAFLRWADAVLAGWVRHLLPR